MLRQIRAVILGLWYSFALATSLVSGLKLLSADYSTTGLGEHYVFGGLLWAFGIGISSYFAGLKSLRYPIIVGSVSALLPPSVLSVFVFSRGDTLQADQKISPLFLGWTPSANAIFFGLSSVVLLAGILGGVAARGELARVEGKYPSNEELTLGIRNRHWLWLWFPMSSWACALPSAGYLWWFLLASGWYWILHPSIWFNWRWWLFFSVGAITTYLPCSCLATGIGEAWEKLANGRARGMSGIRVAMGFVTWGYGYSFVALWIAVLAGEWVVSKLPLASESKPWWIFF
jgi:hypothetical protein